MILEDARKVAETAVLQNHGEDMQVIGGDVFRGEFVRDMDTVMNSAGQDVVGFEFEDHDIVVSLDDSAKVSPGDMVQTSWGRYQIVDKQVFSETAEIMRTDKV